MKNVFVIYHSADFDGLFSRAIAYLTFGESAEYLGWNYGDAVPEIPAEVEQLYMIDISIEPLMGDERLVWIDHHATAIEKFPESIRGYRIDGVAACRLAWQWFAGLVFEGRVSVQRSAFQAMRGIDGGDSWGLPRKDQYLRRAVTEPLAVRLAGEYDIWDHRDPRAKLFQHGLRSEDLDWPKLLAEHEDDEPGADERYVEQLLEQGKPIAYYVAKRDAEHIKKAGFDLQWEGLTFLACNASGYNSHLFTAAIKPHHDALLGFRWDGGKWLISLYGVPHRPNLDLSAIAARHKGGGHRQACGFECLELPFYLGGTPLDRRIGDEALRILELAGAPAFSGEPKIEEWARSIRKAMTPVSPAAGELRRLALIVFRFDQEHINAPQVEGVFSTHELARAACTSDDDVYLECDLDVRLPETTGRWCNAYWPTKNQIMRKGSDVWENL